MNYDIIFEEDNNYTIRSEEINDLKNYLIQKRGWVYIAYSKNNHLLKIGRTSKNPLERAKTLSSTGVLYDYEILFSIKTFNQFLMERKVHKVLKKYRVSKEFFLVNQETAIEVLKQEQDKEIKSLTKLFNFEMISEDIELIEYALKKPFIK